jgi:hypothetical protein
MLRHSKERFEIALEGSLRLFRSIRWHSHEWLCYLGDGDFGA